MTADPPRPMPEVSGVILAGGRSSRFGSDKLAARLGDRTLLDHAIAGVAAVASEIGRASCRERV